MKTQFDGYYEGVFVTDNKVQKVEETIGQILMELNTDDHNGHMILSAEISTIGSLGVKIVLKTANCISGTYYLSKVIGKIPLQA